MAREIEEIGPQRKATVGECDVSAVFYVVTEGDNCATYAVCETCLFFPNGTSRVVGTYDDFDTVVATLRAANPS